MAGKVHVKQGDTVIVLTGKDEGSKGKVMRVIPNSRKVVVQGVNITAKHKKPRSRTQQGGIIKQESPVDISNVMLICPRCSQPARVGKRILESGEKARVCKKCGEVVDIAREARDDRPESRQKENKLDDEKNHEQTTE